MRDYDHDPIANPAKTNPAFSRDLTAGDQTFVSIGGTTDGLTALEGVPAVNVEVGSYTQASLVQLQTYCSYFIPAYVLVYLHYPRAVGFYDANTGYCAEGYVYGGLNYYYYTYVYGYQPQDFYGMAQAYPAIARYSPLI